MVLIGYTAINKRTNERVEFFAHSEQTAQRLGKLSAYHWIVNHLDVSYEWNYYPNGKFKLD
jgi:hypothetical protein